MPNPEQGPQQQGLVGTWQTVNLGIPDFLEEVREAVDQFFSLLIQILNILLQILEILKTFAIGFLDPIIALIEALLALLEAILNDLRQAGLYLHGDWSLLKGPEFRNLLGGFTAYERRMITRLVDRRDPNRPNISSFSACIAVFLYVSVDISALERLIRLIRGILALFTRKIPLPRSLGAVVQLRATYGYEGAAVTSFAKPGFFPTREQLKNEKLSDAFNAVNITWRMAPTPGNFLTTFAQLPPSGFLVEVSTISQGITVQYDKPIKGANEGQEDNKGRDVGTAVNEDGQPIVLFGGYDQLRVEDSLQFNEGVTGQGPFRQLKPLSVRVFGVKSLSDAAPIQFSDLKDASGNYYIQKTFYTSGFAGAFFPGKGYGITIPFEEMPFDAEFGYEGGLSKFKPTGRPSKFFVRVRAVSKTIKKPEDFAYDVARVFFDDVGNPVTLPLVQPFPFEEATTPGDAGPLSAPLEIVFPGGATEEYLRCVVSALAVMVLSRADLPVKVGTSSTEGDAPTIHTFNYPPTEEDLEFEGASSSWSGYEGQARKYTQLEELAGVLTPQLLGRKWRVAKFYESTNNLARWRKRLLARCVNLTNRMYRENRPPASLEEVVVSTCKDLLDFKFDLGESVSIIEALSSREVKSGLAPNPLSIGITSPGRNVEQMEDPGLLARAEHFFQISRRGGKSIQGSVDKSPVVFSRRNNIDIDSLEFCRNAFSDAIYEQAAFALRVAVGPFQRPQEDGWIAIRLFPQGLPAIDRFLDELLALLRSIRAALQAITDLIKRFIEFLQSRIIELQALLNRINAMIQNLLRFFIGIPAAAGLVVVAPGTDGVLSALVSAGNKPYDSPRAYGGGVVMLAGGIPTIALDLFKALVQGSG